MAWRSHGSSNASLVKNLSQNSLITKDKVRKAMENTDRKHYSENNPYEDSPQRIGYAATISAPHMHAIALEYIHDQLTSGDQVTALDVGSGTGYLTACMARMAGAGGRVVGLEHIPELAEVSVKNLNNDDSSLLQSGQVKIVIGDGRNGYAPHYDQQTELYDAIHVGAAAKEVPKALLNQLKRNGRLIVPVGPHGGTQSFQQWDKDANGELHQKELMKVRYVPLTDKDKQLRF